MKLEVRAAEKGSSEEDSSESWTTRRKACGSVDCLSEHLSPEDKRHYGRLPLGLTRGGRQRCQKSVTGKMVLGVLNSYIEMLSKCLGELEAWVWARWGRIGREKKATAVAGAQEGGHYDTDKDRSHRLIDKLFSFTN
ncbi:hypothetical protein R3P38DRAFT_2772375 [Favolaschia claudopus]|uniref:Uncharacterized protein n=1 Tax=Favolaschia claudopus TaxID=2862362 RepID=A0AAW0C698_9AGAR